MDNQLAPALAYLFGDHWVLWFNTSNCYNIVDKKFKLHLDLYLKAETILEFEQSIALKDDNKHKDIAHALNLYLNDCNNTTEQKNLERANKAPDKRKILSYYHVNNSAIEIYYDSELVQKILHPSIAHLQTKPNTAKANVTFDLYLNDGDLCLFKNDALLIKVPKKDYHKIQGKFMMHLFCCIHNKNETDWIGTFHGSTIGNGTSSILFIGESGKGKSTLCALLAANGFDLIADDISPLLAADLNIYTNPAAVSIKSGAFNALRPLIKNFEDLKEQQLSKSKGLIKFIPFTYPNKSHYPCDAIVLINFEKGSKTELQKVSMVRLLETLIPDSWLSPNPNHAKQFLEWLNTIDIYQLTYSNNEHVTKVITDLFSKNEGTY